MNDTTIIILGLSGFAVIVWWWFHSLEQMRRKVDTLADPLINDEWRPFTPKNGRYAIDLPKQHLAYRTYRAFVAFINDHIVLDRSADSERTDSERGQR